MQQTTTAEPITIIWIPANSTAFEPWQFHECRGNPATIEDEFSREFPDRDLLWINAGHGPEARTMDGAEGD